MRIKIIKSVLAFLVCGFVLVCQNTGAETVGDWVNRINVKGDLRLRHEWDQHKKGPDDQNDTNKERFRLRLGLEAKVNEFTAVNVRFATSDGANPISTNSTFTDDGGKKQFYVDEAYADIQLGEHGHLDLGKTNNNLRIIDVSQLIYDADYTPEGAALRLKLGDSAFVNLGAFVIQQHTPDSPDAGLLGAIVGVKSDNTRGTGFLVALGYHDFGHIKGNAALAPTSTLIPFNGNSNDGSKYLYDYQVGEAVGEFHFRTSRFTWTLYADGIENFAVTKQNTGLLAGLSLSRLNEHDRKVWQIGYTYQTLAKDATLAAVNFSDLGDGYDGSFGHMLTAEYVIAANMSASISYLRAYIANNGRPFWMNTGLADFMMKF